MGIVTNQVAVALDRDQAQQALRNVNVALEDKVRERTATLAQMVDNLESEIELREQAEADLSKANQELADQATQLRSLAGELTMAEQRERKRLSQVLHDGLQQYLAAAKLQLSSLSPRITDDGTQKTVRDIEGIITESISISRSLSAELSPTRAVRRRSARRFGVAGALVA